MTLHVHICNYFICLRNSILCLCVSSGSVATVESTSYTVREDGGTIGVGIILDRPNCAILNITVLPRVQSPVDASSKQ